MRKQIDLVCQKDCFEMVPSERYVVDHELEAEQQKRQRMVVVLNIYQEVEDKLTFDLVIRHSSDICQKDFEIQPEA